MARKRQYNKQLTPEDKDGVAIYVREEEQVAEKQPEQKVDFDAWFVMREHKIPKHHHKEIIKADFRGRGLEQCESLEAFDAALTKYGIKL